MLKKSIFFLQENSTNISLTMIYYTPLRGAGMPATKLQAKLFRGSKEVVLMTKNQMSILIFILVIIIFILVIR